MMCAMLNICYAQSVQKNDSTVTVNKTVHNFGDIRESDGSVECEFLVTNTGDKHLSIIKVSTSCGCTVSDWTKEPIVSGKKGIVKVTFNPKGRKGNFNKSLVVFTNGTPSSIRLKVIGNIKP